MSARATKRQRAEPKALRCARGSDNEYTLRKGHKTAWVTVGSVSVHVVRTDEGVVVNLFAKGHEMDDHLATTYAYENEALERIEEAGAVCRCDNCGYECPRSELKEAKDLDERMDLPPDHPDAIVPDGECPECGALSYEVKAKKRRARRKTAAGAASCVAAPSRDAG